MNSYRVMVGLVFVTAACFGRFQPLSADGDQRLELLAAHRFRKFVTARAECVRHLVSPPAGMPGGPILFLVRLA